MVNLSKDFLSLSVIIILLLIVLVGLINYNGIYSILFCHLINIIAIYLIVYVY